MPKKKPIKSVMIVGGVDDVVEIRGDVQEEYVLDGDLGFIGCGDGTLISVEIEEESGQWLFSQVTAGSADIKIHDHETDTGQKTKAVTMAGDLNWFIFGYGIMLSQ